MITSGAQLRQAQTDIQTLWRFLEAARATHAPLDYERLAAPYLLQLQERQQEVIEYFTRQINVTKAHHMAEETGSATSGTSGTRQTGGARG